MKEQMAALMGKLLEEDRMDDLKQAAKNSSLQLDCFGASW